MKDSMISFRFRSLMEIHLTMRHIQIDQKGKCDMSGTDRNGQHEDIWLSQDLKSPRVLAIKDRTLIQAYVFYLFYRIQLDLYEMGKEAGLLDHILWDDFVFAVRCHQKTRERSYKVANEAITEAIARESFNFNSAITEFPFDDDTINGAGDVVHCAQLFSFERGEALIDYLLLGIEIAQYGRQLQYGKGYDWEGFITELEVQETMWDETLSALRDTMAGLDLKPFWSLDTLDDLIIGNEAD